MNAEFKKTVPPSPTVPPEYLPPLAPLEVKKILGMFLASILAQVSRNITKYNMNAEFKKTVPPTVPPEYSPPLAPLGVKKFFGMFLASILAQVWWNITKNTKNADFKKTGPPGPPFTCPPVPPGDPKVLPRPKNISGYLQGWFKTNLSPHMVQSN